MTLLLAVLLIACGDKDAGDTGTGTGGADGGGGDAGTADGGTTDGGSTDGGTSDGGTSDGGTSDGGTSDGGTSDGGTSDGGTTGPQEGLLTIEGQAQVVSEWSGTETITLRGDLGLGEVACEIAYDVTSTAPAEGCDACIAAWQVVLGDATVSVDDACEAAGYDGATIAAIAGEERNYGIALNYTGHANVLLQETKKGRWDVVSYVTWNESDGTVSYSWEQGYVEY